MNQYHNLPHLNKPLYHCIKRQHMYWFISLEIIQLVYNFKTKLLEEIPPKIDNTPNESPRRKPNNRPSERINNIIIEFSWIRRPPVGMSSFLSTNNSNFYSTANFLLATCHATNFAVELYVSYNNLKLETYTSRPLEFFIFFP